MKFVAMELRAVMVLKVPAKERMELAVRELVVSALNLDVLPKMELTLKLLMEPDCEKSVSVRREETDIELIVPFVKTTLATSRELNSMVLNEM